MTIRVVIADDQPLIRAGFGALISSDRELELVAEASDGEQAIAAAHAWKPDVILMDIRMPGRDGLSATAQIVADPELAGVRVLILTTFEADEHVVAALQAGASGFLGKDVGPTELLAAIRTVASGEALLSARATRTLIDRFLSSPSPAPSAPPTSLGILTDREREVLGLVGRGFSNDEIASALYVSPLTAKTHVNRAMSKLNARDRAQLVVIAYQSGLVRAGDPGPAGT